MRFATILCYGSVEYKRRFFKNFLTPRTAFASFRDALIDNADDARDLLLETHSHHRDLHSGGQEKGATGDSFPLFKFLDHLESISSERK